MVHGVMIKLGKPLVELLAVLVKDVMNMLNLKISPLKNHKRKHLFVLFVVKLIHCLRFCREEQKLANIFVQSVTQI